MPEIYLGELEQIVLLAVLRLGERAYAVPILEQIEEQTGRTMARGALYTALDRLEAKGCLRSRLGDPLPERGGRARRHFTVPAAAIQALKHSRPALLRLWGGLGENRGERGGPPPRRAGCSRTRCAPPDATWCWAISANSSPATAAPGTGGSRSALRRTRSCGAFPRIYDAAETASC